MNNPGIVTLITDFGTRGEYSGAMKGAILSVNPRCRIVDITHEIEPQNILQASWVLKNSYPYFPPGTVHTAVVDPGVGTMRRAIVLAKKGHSFVGPDNGIFTAVFSGDGNVSAHEITQKKFFLSPKSDTFHGRDVFAPVAGHLSLGAPARSFGPPAKNCVTLEWPLPKLSGRTLRAKVLWADSFGNLITNVSREEYGTMLESGPILINGKGWRIHRLRRTYGEGRAGEPMALFGSGGLLEISQNRGSALKALGLKPGDPVGIRLP